jgi:tetratricopeptide (TPR) repeat protein
VWLGWGLEELGEFEEAINCYDKALKINPEHKMAGEYKEACLKKL